MVRVGGVFLFLDEVEEVDDGVQGIVNFMRDGRREAPGDGEFFGGEQSILSAALVGDVTEDHDDPGERAAAIVNGCATVVDEYFRAVAANEERVIGEADDALEALDARDGGFNRLACNFVDDAEDVFERQVEGVVLTPAGEFLGDGIEQFDATVGVADDDAVADRGKSGADALFGLECGLGVEAKGVEGSLVGVRDAVQAADGKDADEDAGGERKQDQDFDGGMHLHRPAFGFLGAECGLAVEHVVDAFPQGVHELLAADVAVDVASVAAGGDLCDQGFGVADAPGILGGDNGVDHRGPSRCAAEIFGATA